MRFKNFTTEYAELDEGTEGGCQRDSEAQRHWQLRNMRSIGIVLRRAELQDPAGFAGKIRQVLRLR